MLRAARLQSAFRCASWRCGVHVFAMARWYAGGEAGPLVEVGLIFIVALLSELTAVVVSEFRRGAEVRESEKQAFRRREG